MISEFTKRCDTTSQIRGDEGIRASVVDDKSWGCEIGVAAAVEFLLEKGLGVLRLEGPDGKEVCAGFEGGVPDYETEDHGEHAGEHYHVAVDFDEGAVRGGEDAGEGGEEGYEDED